MVLVIHYYAQEVLCSDGWQENKTLIIDQGVIHGIEDGKHDDAQILSGPVIPGMTNLHSHAFQKILAGLTEYRSSQADSFWSWRNAMYKAVPFISPDDLKIIAEFAYIEMLRYGYTSVIEFHYLHHQQGGQQYNNPAEMSESIVHAAQSSGIQLTHCPVFYACSNFGDEQLSHTQKMFSHSLEDYQTLLETLHHQYQDEDNIAFGCAPHSLRAASKAHFEHLIPWWQSFAKNRPIHIHIAEQMKEVEACRQFYHATPVEWLFDQVGFDKHWCLVHATHLTDIEVELIASSGAVAGLCPTTEANLGDGVFKAKDYFKQQGNWGIGSDSHVCLNPMQELRLLEYSQRLQYQKRNILCTDDENHVGHFLWKQASIGGGAAACRMTGKIEVDYAADLLVLNRDVVELYALDMASLLDTAMFALNNNPVKDVMVSGEWVIQDGVHARQETSELAYRQVQKNVISHL